MERNARGVAERGNVRINATALTTTHTPIQPIIQRSGAHASASNPRRTNHIVHGYEYTTVYRERNARQNPESSAYQQKIRHNSVQSAEKEKESMFHYEGAIGLEVPRSKPDAKHRGARR